MIDEAVILIELFKPSALVPISKEYGKECVKLTEPQAPDSSVTIRNLPADALVIKVDSFRSPDNVFYGTKGECKRADYVIISVVKKCIIYIELKSTSDSHVQIVQQLAGAQCFITYCQAIVKEFWRNSQFLAGYRSRFLCIGHTSLAKKKTRIDRNTGVHDTPDKMMKIDWANAIQFNQLAGLSK